MQQIAIADKRGPMTASNVAAKAMTARDNSLLPAASLTADLIRRGRDLNWGETQAHASSPQESSDPTDEVSVDPRAAGLAETSFGEPDAPSRMEPEIQGANHVLELPGARRNDSKAGMILNDVILFMTVFAASCAVILAVLLSV